MLPRELSKIKQEDGADEDSDNTWSAAGHREWVREMALRMAKEADIGLA